MGQLLTINSMCRMFKVSRQTIYNWRTKSDMPFIEFPDDGTSFVRFDREKVKRWAIDNGITFYDS